MEPWIVESTISAINRVDILEVRRLVYISGFKYYNFGMILSAEAGSQHLIDLFVNLGADAWDWGLGHAAKSKKETASIIDFFISKGATKLKEAILFAVTEGNLQNVKHLIRRGAKVTDECLEQASIYGRLHTVQYLCSFKNSPKALRRASEGAYGAGNKEVCAFLSLKM
jgi:hypothetical protein